MKAKRLIIGALLAFCYASCFSQEIHSGIIYNMQGPGRGAWDLQNHIPLSASKPSFGKDLVNTTEISDPQPFFRRQWSSFNGTLFVKNAQVSFENAVYDSLEVHFNLSAQTSQQVSDIAVGDLYIAKLRNSDTLAIIQIVELVDDGCSLLCAGANNMDYIKFDYKVLVKPVLSALGPTPILPEETKQILKEAKVELSIYPNPMTASSTIEISPIQSSPCTVTIYDMTGNVVHGELLPASESKLIVSKNQLPSGLYVVALQSSKAVLGQIRLRVE